MQTSDCTQRRFHPATSCTARHGKRRTPDRYVQVGRPSPAFEPSIPRISSSIITKPRSERPYWPCQATRDHAGSTVSCRPSSRPSRDRISVAPYDPTAPVGKQVAQSFESSLEHLHTDYIDSYVLHGPYGRWELEQEDWDVWTALERPVSGRPSQNDRGQQRPGPSTAVAVRAGQRETHGRAEPLLRGIGMGPAPSGNICNVTITSCTRGFRFSPRIAGFCTTRRLALLPNGATRGRPKSSSGLPSRWACSP